MDKVEAVLSVLKRIKPGGRTNLLVSTVLWCAGLTKPRYKAAVKNMVAVFPNITEEHKKQMYRESLESLAWTGAEMFGWQNNPELINTWTVETEGKHYIDEALGQGHGVLFLTAHIGNWEHAAAWIGYNYSAWGIAQYNKSLFQKELIGRLRATSGLRILGTNEPMTRAASILKKNGLVGIVSDQHGGGDGITVPLFGQYVSTPQGLAVFSWLTKAAIIPGRSVRLAPYKFKMEFQPPIKWKKLATREETIYDITLKANRVIEKWVQETPEQWLWLHKRFKETVNYE